MKSKILILSLYRGWFDLILSGDKIIEYREIKPFWEKRFAKNTYEYIRFINGYGKLRPSFLIELKGITKTDKFELHLGKILETNNMSKSA
jgi:hypothetical protein